MVSVRIPKSGQATTEGTIAKWLVDDGEPVEEGQALYLLETDKVEMEVEAPASGTLRTLAPEGTTHEVGAEIAQIEQ
jgi:pyruvate/2-oxoglutarate dehydrogenase complex dihydrolipoamide acyltransferase (E2) component